MQGISLLRRFIHEAYHLNRRAGTDARCGQPDYKWDADSNEPLYYHDPTSTVALQTDDEEPWERSPLSDLQGHNKD